MFLKHCVYLSSAVVLFAAVSSSYSYQKWQQNSTEDCQSKYQSFHNAVSVLYTKAIKDASASQDFLSDLRSLLAQYAYESGSPKNGLVAYFAFNGNANDEAGNGRNCIIKRATISSDRFGNQDCAYAFNGTSSISSSFSSGLPTGNRTICVWVYSNDFAQPNRAIAGYGIGASSQRSYIAFGQGDQPDRKPFFWGHGADVVSSSPVSNGSWHFIVARITGNIGELFVDNALVANSSISLNTPSVTSLNIGGPEAELSGFTGKIDDLRIYNRSLLDSEISALYHEGGWEANR